ncbi:MAG: hypothetical protein PUB37_00385, partial [Firmicutes bacterium]|nr:hypothetical protein [Bacillota bacterium]
FICVTSTRKSKIFSLVFYELRIFPIASFSCTLALPPRPHDGLNRYSRNSGVPFDPAKRADAIQGMAVSPWIPIVNARLWLYAKLSFIALKDKTGAALFQSRTCKITKLHFKLSS